MTSATERDLGRLPPKTDLEMSVFLRKFRSELVVKEMVAGDETASEEGQPKHPGDVDRVAHQALWQPKPN